jgi:hypothetical protein
MASIQKRTSASGDISYRVQIRLKGHPIERATFSRITDARNWAQATESAIKERRYFKTSESRKHTMADLIDRYLKRIERDNPKRIKDIQPMLLWWKSEIGYCVLSDLTRSLIAEHIDKLAQRTVGRRDADTGIKRPVPISPARINRHISALSHACTIAVNEWEWLEDNPMHKISKLKEPRGRVRFLSDDERTT